MTLVTDTCVARVSTTIISARDSTSTMQDLLSSTLVASLDIPIPLQLEHKFWISVTSESVQQSGTRPQITDIA